MFNRMYLQTSIDRNKKLWSYLKGVFKSEISEENSRYEANMDYIKQPLYIHQKALLRSALDLESTKATGLDCGGNRKLFTNFGILADRVGSGKSLVALSLVKQSLPEENEIITIQRGTNISMICSKITEPTKKRVAAALFIIPHNLVSQWEDYVINWTSLNAIFCKKKKEASDRSILHFIDSVDAVFVSSTMWKSFEDIVKPDKIHWSRIFIDEADSIQAQIRTNLTAKFIWLITASYLNIAFPTGILLTLDSPFNQPTPEVNNPDFLEQVRAISGRAFKVDGIFTNAPFIKGILGSTDILKNSELQTWRITLRNSDNFINTSFTMPSISHRKIFCRASAHMRILESLIPNDVMDMLHAGDTRGAFQALGVHDESAVSVIESLTKTLRKDLGQQTKKLEFYKTMEYSSEAAKQRSIELQETKVISIENRIHTIEKRMTEIETTNCPICYSDVEIPTLTPCCKNLFCFVCLCESLKRQASCPLCRTAIANVNELHIVNSKANTIYENNESRQKTKTEEFISFAEQNPKAKILLFSTYDASFFNLTSEMQHKNIPFTTINGSTSRVSKIIKEFETGAYRVLLLNSKHVGAGLNITAASDVFLFHKMPSELEKQIIGRAYRMGRTEPLRVHHLLHATEISPGEE